MGGGTGTTVAAIVGTVEIFDIVVALVEMIIQVVTTIRTDQQTAENVSLTILGFALTDLSALFLDLFPDYTVNDGLMDVFENQPVLPVIIDPLLILVGFGISFEVENITAILLDRQHLHNGGLAPFGRTVKITFAWALNTPLLPIGSWGEYTIPFKLCGNLLWAKAIQGHAEYMRESK